MIFGFNAAFLPFWIVITGFFSQKFLANFVKKNNADLIISGSVNTYATSETSNDYGIYQVFGDMTLTIYNGITKEKIIEKSFNKIQGSAFQSNQEAANNSLKNMSERINKYFQSDIKDLIDDFQ